MAAAAALTVLPARGADEVSMTVRTMANQDCTFAFSGEGVTFADNVLTAPVGATVTITTTNMTDGWSVTPQLYTSSGVEELVFDRIENNLPVFTFAMPPEGTGLYLPYQRGNLEVGGVYFVGIANAYKALTPENNVLSLTYSSIDLDYLPDVPCTFQGTDRGRAINMPKELTMNSDVTFNSVTFSVWPMQSTTTIYANGHKLVFGPQCSGPQYYTGGWQNLMTVYGGSGVAGESVESTDVTVTGVMNIATLYAGGRNSDVTGEAKVTITGSTVTTLCAGGDGGSVGSSSVSIARQETYPNFITTIYGVSSTPGSTVKGNVSFDLTGACIWNMGGFYAAGPDDSETVGGDVNINGINRAWNDNIPVLYSATSVSGMVNVALSPMTTVARWASAPSSDDNSVGGAEGAHFTLQDYGSEDAIADYAFPKGVNALTLNNSYMRSTGAPLTAPLTINGDGSVIEGTMRVDAPSAAEAVVTLKEGVALAVGAEFEYGNIPLVQMKPGSEIYCIVSGLPSLDINDASVTAIYDEDCAVVADGVTHILPGTEVTLDFSALGDRKYDVTLNGEAISPSSDGTYTFAMPASGANVAVTEYVVVVGVGNVNADSNDGSARFFTIDGRATGSSDLRPGVYVRVAGGQTTKILVR